MQESEREQERDWGREREKKRETERESERERWGRGIVEVRERGGKEREGGWGAENDSVNTNM